MHPERSKTPDVPLAAGAPDHRRGCSMCERAWRPERAQGGAVVVTLAPGAEVEATAGSGTRGPQGSGVALGRRATSPALPETFMLL